MSGEARIVGYDHGEKIVYVSRYLCMCVSVLWDGLREPTEHRVVWGGGG